ncbi:MAG: hypothetical protein ABWW69_02155 [Pyrodictiaceae archaeon]
MQGLGATKTLIDFSGLARPRGERGLLALLVILVIVMLIALIARLPGPAFYALIAAAVVLAIAAIASFSQRPGSLRGKWPLIELTYSVTASGEKGLIEVKARVVEAQAPGRIRLLALLGACSYMFSRMGLVDRYYTPVILVGGRAESVEELASSTLQTGLLLEGRVETSILEPTEALVFDRHGMSLHLIHGGFIAIEVESSGAVATALLPIIFEDDVERIVELGGSGTAYALVARRGYMVRPQLLKAPGGRTETTLGIRYRVMVRDESGRTYRAETELPLISTRGAEGSWELSLARGVVGGSLVAILPGSYSQALRLYALQSPRELARLPLLMRSVSCGGLEAIASYYLSVGGRVEAETPL